MSLPLSDIERLLPDALERLYEYSHLGAHPLVTLSCVAALVIHDQTPLTHVDYGRALSKALQAAIDEMKPDGAPADIGHEARYYRILVEAYREGRENSEVAANLAISERTFYRERRRAIQALAKIVWDMDNGA
jgi:hypothetical protein